MYFDDAQQPDRQRPHVSLRACVALWLAAFALYAARAVSVPYVLDSSELAAAAFGLGVAHPPGEPLALMFGKMWSLLPFGSVALRVALGQAACGAAAVVCVYVLARKAMAVVAPVPSLSQPVHAVAAGAGALVFAMSPGAIDVASRAEVYALASALALAALLCASEAHAREDARWAVAAACLLGLGLANHPLIAGAAGVGAVAASAPLLIEASKRERARLVVAAVAAMAAGALALLYVPTRAFALMRQHDVNTLLWGDARSLQGWWWVLSARTFADKNALVQTSADPASLPFLFIEELHLPAVACAALGIYAAARVSRASRAWALPALLTAAGACAAALLGGLDPHNPDVRGYLAVAFAVAAVFAACGAAVVLVRWPKRWLSAFVAAAVIAWPVYSVATAWPSSDAQRVPERAVRDAMGQLPPGAVLLTGHFETGFLLAYQRLVEGARPDVTWAHMGFARGPGYAERMMLEAPELAPLFAAHAHGPLSAQAVDDLAAPLAVEAMVPLDVPLARALNYSGGLWHWPPVPVAAEAERLSDTQWQQARAQREVWAFLAWRLLQDAQLACAASHPIARALVERLLVALPSDNLVRQLARTCDAPVP